MEIKAGQKSVEIVISKCFYFLWLSLALNFLLSNAPAFDIGNMKKKKKNQKADAKSTTFCVFVCVCAAWILMRCLCNEEPSFVCRMIFHTTS